MAKKFGRLRASENSKMTHSHPYIYYTGYAQILLTWHAVFIYCHASLHFRIFYYWYYVTFTVFSILMIYYVHTGKQSKRYFCPIKCCTNKHSQQEVLNNVNTQISIFASLHKPCCRCSMLPCTYLQAHTCCFL